MNLDAVSTSLLHDARRQADEILQRAEDDRARDLAAARLEAEQIIERARAEGEAAALAQSSQQRARMRREAHELVLQAQRRAYDLVRRRLNEELLRRREDTALMAALTRLARSQLGESAEIISDDQVPGIVARDGLRSVDYRLPAIAERLLRNSGAEVSRLWQ